MQLSLKTTMRTPSLTRLRRVLDDTESINRVIADKLLKDIDKNIVDQGIWEGWKWAAPKESTTYARVMRGKDARPLFGLRGRFGARIAKTRFTIFSTSRFAELMQEGPKKRSWTIWPSRKKSLFFPHPDGRPRKNIGGLWIFAGKVTHRGWIKRRIMPPLDEVGFTARTTINEFIRGAL